MMYPEEITQSMNRNQTQTQTQTQTKTQMQIKKNGKNQRPRLGFIWLNLALIALMLALFSYIDYTPTVTIESFKPNGPYPLPANPFSECDQENNKDKDKEKEKNTDKDTIPEPSEETVVDFYDECPENVEETNYVALLIATPTYSIDPSLLFSIIKDTWGDETKIRIIRGCTPFDQDFLGRLS